MSHARRQIRDAVVTLLTGLATTGANVFVDRDTASKPLAAADLPALKIDTGPEQVDERSLGSQVTATNRTTKRTLTLDVTAVDKLASGLFDTLDQICLEVEKAMLADVFLGGLAEDTRIMATDPSKDESGGQPTGEQRMTFEIDYWCADGAPDVITN